jgi:MipA family protein
MGIGMRIALFSAFSAGLILSASSAFAGDAWWSGDWYVKLGGAGFVAPKYEGDNSYMLQGTPMISIGKGVESTRFTSRNDNPSFAFLENGMYRAGIVGKLVMPRDRDTSSDLKGMDPVRFGVEAGGFAEIYPTDWMRIRAELRRGIRSHDGIVADVSADAFTDITDTIRLSAGPRASFATEGYMDAYYGVDAKESAKSGLKKYHADGGITSAGLGAAINWKATENVDTSIFAEYSRLLGDAADSSLVRERGSKNQFLVGLSATYRFGFTLD